ncbi:deaminase [Pontibacter sp. JAM-7]|uniref:deaminase n=1 Tax=Pontibacter sp. JAM-7 TaxID=3366581 RepID=UPI003AF6EF34
MIEAPSISQLEQQLAVCRTQYQSGSLAEQRALHCCTLAMAALSKGNYGVAAILIDANGAILSQAANGVFTQGYHPGAHAEISLLERFQLDYPDYANPQQLTLLSLLEPCPMCLCRILASGIGRLQYLVADPQGGMVSHLAHLPPAWKNLAQLCQITCLKLPQELADLAGFIATAQRAALRRKTLRYIRPSDL